jgi:hypothetical protein
LSVFEDHAALAIGFFADDKVEIEVGHSDRLLRCSY